MIGVPSKGPGFDPYCGFYPVGRHGRPSLALDLMEEFRSIIADSVVITLVNNELLSGRDFLVWREACQLTPEGRLPTDAEAARML